MLSSWIKSQFKQAKSSAYVNDIVLLCTGGTVAQIIAVAIMPLASRLYTPEFFAIANLVVLWVGFLVVPMTCRFEYFVQLPKLDVDAWSLVRLVAFLGITWTSILTPALWFWRDTIANWAGHPKLGPWLIAVPITAATLALSNAIQGWNQRRGNYHRSAGSEIISKTGYAGVVVGGHWVLPDAGGLVLATFGSHAAKIAALFVYDRPARHSWDAGKLWTIGRAQGRLAGGMIFAHLCLACTAMIPAMFISRKYGADVLGQFSLAFQTVCLPEALIGNAIGNVYYQRIAEDWSRGGSRISFIFRSTAIRLILIGAPVFGGAVLVLPWLLPIIFGGQWHEAGRYSALLAISAFGSLVSAALGRTCLVVGAWWYLPLWHLLRATSTLSVVWIADYMLYTSAEFVTLIICQQITMFFIDVASQRYFAQSLRFSPHGEALTPISPQRIDKKG